MARWVPPRKRNGNAKPEPRRVGESKIQLVHAALGNEPPTAERIDGILYAYQAKGFIKIGSSPEGPTLMPILGFRDFLKLVLELGAVLDDKFRLMELTDNENMDTESFMKALGVDEKFVLSVLVDHALIFPEP